ncbi:MAG: hypothetical protein M1838_000595 [Thelocarpon superellum]|nr:MAG: hypothetical protein M1838_000595 [Thelocarpon superellum]
MAGLAGYMIGQGVSLGLFGRFGRASHESALESDDESEVDDEDPPAKLSEFDTNRAEEYKLVLVVRTDLGMTKACYKTLLRTSPPSDALRRWEHQGQAKVALQVKDEDQFSLLQAQAISLGLCAKVVRDAGRTQIAAGSATVLGIGPGPKSVIDQVTGGLKLL